MKILVVADFPSSTPGGAQAIVELVTRELLKSGNTCKIATYPQFTSNILSKICNVIWIREALSLINLLAIIRMTMLQLRYRPDVIWYHNINNRWSWAILRINLNHSRKLMTLHDLTAISNRKLNFEDVNSIIKQSCFSLHKVRISVIKFFIRSVTTVSIGEICHKVLIAMGFRVDARILNRVEPCIHNLPSEKDAKTVLFAGRSYLKGIDYVARAVAVEKEWKLIIASDENAYKTALEYCPQDRIQFLGMVSREELLQLLHKINLVAVCSQYLDNYPTIGLEALAHGAIPFTTSCTGLAELLIKISPSLIIGPGTVPNLTSILSAANVKKVEISETASLVQDFSRMIGEYLALIIDSNPSKKFV